MRRSVSIATLLSLCAVNAFPAELRPFQRLDVFELEWVSDPQISPDGRWVVYGRNGMDVMKDARTARLWLIGSDGKGNRPLTGTDAPESNPRWSPDGSRIAYTGSTENGAEIFVYWLEKGISTRLTQLDRSPSGLTWSPDGTQIAFTMLVPEEPPVLVSGPKKPKGASWAESPRITTRLQYERDGAGYIEPGYTQLFVLSELGGTPRQVTGGAFRHEGPPRWSRDGKRLFFSGNRNADWELRYVNSEIYAVAVETGEIVALTDQDGPDASPQVSPDGGKIAYLSYADRVQAYQLTKLMVMNVDGSEKRDVLPDFDRSVDAIAWSAGGDGLYFQYDDKGDTKIDHTSLSGRMRTLATQLGGTQIGRPYGGGSFSVARNGRIAYTHVTPYRPAELAIVGSQGGEPQVITTFNADLLEWRDLGRVEELWYRSSVDGRDIQGWVVKPPGYDPSKPYPLLVEIHGGPILNYGPRFSPEMQLYAAAGYVVFNPNARGSTGYGEEFANLLHHNYPGDDYQDVMDGVDALIAKGITAEGRLYVTGGSAGGIMTAWIIGKGQRFRAAAVVNPVMNWVSKTLTADNYFEYANYRLPGQPWESIETYMKYSPISLVGNIQTPTLVMVGTSDMRTPLSEAKQLYGALKIRGIETALVEMQGAPHNISGRPSQLIAKVDHILAWFARYPFEPK